jgi:FAD/FMN-containing dehydrogenase
VVSSANQHTDLFWAMRGGGGNFGVVTSLEFRLHPRRPGLRRTSFFEIDRAGETLARYREWVADAPDALGTAVLMMRLPDAPEVPDPLRGRRVLAIPARGEPEEAERLLRPLRAATGPTRRSIFWRAPASGRIRRYRGWRSVIGAARWPGLHPTPGRWATARFRSP